MTDAIKPSGSAMVAAQARASDCRDGKGRWLPRDAANDATTTHSEQSQDTRTVVSNVVPLVSQRQIDIVPIGDRVYITTPRPNGAVVRNSVGFTHDEARCVAQRMLELVGAHHVP